MPVSPLRQLSLGGTPPWPLPCFKYHLPAGLPAFPAPALSRGKISLPHGLGSGSRTCWHAQSQVHVLSKCRKVLAECVLHPPGSLSAHLLQGREGGLLSSRRLGRGRMLLPKDMGCGPLTRPRKPGTDWETVHSQQAFPEHL